MPAVKLRRFGLFVRDSWLHCQFRHFVGRFVFEWALDLADGISGEEGLLVCEEYFLFLIDHETTENFTSSKTLTLLTKTHRLSSY